MRKVTLENGKVFDPELNKLLYCYRSMATPEEVYCTDRCTAFVIDKKSIRMDFVFCEAMNSVIGELISDQPQPSPDRG
jgi:hypothetical protein